MLHAMARRYVEHSDDLAHKTLTSSYARLEGVFLVYIEFNTVMQHRKFFVEPMLDHLLEMVPMLVPFRDDEDGHRLCHVFQPVATFLSTSLYDVLHQSKGLGDYENSWRAFLAGACCSGAVFRSCYFCLSSRQFVSALVMSSRSLNILMRMRGFLCLGPIGSASVGESPPPGLNDEWIKDELQKARVMGIFSLTDAMLADPQVLGDKLARLLLCDLYQWNDHLSGSPSKPGLPVLSDS